MNWPSPKSDQLGFGLLEALIALVLLSSVGFTVLAWVQQNLDTAQRLRLHYEEQEARRYAFEWMRGVNPMETPEGETKRGTLRFVWKAVPEAPVVPQIGYPAGVGKHDLGLYETTISVFRVDDEKPWFSEKLTLIGHLRRGATPGSQLGDADKGGPKEMDLPGFLR